MSMFQKATKQQAFLKVAITGPSGSGKTFSALRLATGLANGGRIAFIDTENQSASLYSDRFNFDVCNVSPPFTHEKFVEAIRGAESAGFAVLVIDSASHFWEGILEFKAKLDARGGNSYTNWNEAGNKFKGIMDAVLQSRLHLIACLRSKMDYVLETNERGKSQPRKVGLAPIMRDGIEYEFTTIFDVGMTHEAQCSKDRTGIFKDSIFQVTEADGEKLRKWLGDVKPAPAKQDAPVPAHSPESRACVDELVTIASEDDMQKILFRAGAGTPGELTDEQCLKAIAWINKKAR